MSSFDPCSSKVAGAVKRISEFQPWKVEGPVELVFKYYPNEKETTGRTVVYKGQSVLEAYEAWLGK